jgi:diadenosine tetraphosphatase ApaH/serine/threonine PP2A family protein phosphatase
VLIFGHTHKPYTKSVENVLFLNAGSIGKPKDGDPRACYIVLDTAGNVSVEFFRIRDDVERVATAIRQSELPDDFASDIETSGASALTPAASA